MRSECFLPVESPMQHQKSLALGLALVLGGAAQATAQDVTPDFGSTVGGPGWVTDRYAPATFNLLTTKGRTNVLSFAITSQSDFANRPAGYQSTFYNTQGMKYAVSQSGSYSLTADLWVDGSWASNPTGSNNSRRTDMWGVSVDASNNPADYPVIGFTNAGGTGIFRGYDVNTGLWNNFANPVSYNAWNTLRIDFDYPTALYSYSVNGSVAGTVQGDGVARGIGAVIMQGYNFNDPTREGDPAIIENGSTDYHAFWSNTAVVATPEPASLVLLGTGLLGVAGVVRRRRKA
jgi:hypothetical protein